MNRISYKTHEERVSALAQSLSLQRFLAWRLGAVAQSTTLLSVASRH